MIGTNIICGLVLCFAVVYGACPHGWSRFHGNCYKYTFDKETWVNARVMCRMHGADLIAIETAEEQAKFVKKALTFNHTDIDDGFWLSATDFMETGTWIWESTSQPLNFTVWADSQPNNLNNKERCLAGIMYFTYKWSDEPCDMEKQYVCEMKMPTDPIVG